MGNSKGSYRSTRENLMAAYDKLPPSARKALQDAAFNWAPQPIVTHWRRGTFKTGEVIAAKVVDWDRDHIRKTAKRTWGIGYPIDISGKLLRVQS